MTAAPREWRVFYSWQSDIDDKINRTPIRIALKEAALRVERKKSGISIVSDEATRSLPGAPYIPGKIVEKIENADIFIADLTTINSSAPDGQRKCQNPNVVFELGIAVTHLGWDRVILLVNTAQGPITDLPFDFDRHRASPFHLSAPDPNAAAQLRNMLVDAIEAIVTSDPKRPAELRTKSEHQIKHERDVENIRRLMAYIHIPTLEAHIENGEQRGPVAIHYFYEGFSRTLNSQNFHLYDTELAAAFTKLQNAWDQATDHGEYFDTTHDGKTRYFYLPGDLFQSHEQEEAFKSIRRACRAMAEPLREVTRIIRDRFLEIHINETSANAGKEYQSLIDETDKFLK